MSGSSGGVCWWCRRVAAVVMYGGCNRGLRRWCMVVVVVGECGDGVLLWLWWVAAVLVHGGWVGGWRYWLWLMVALVVVGGAGGDLTAVAIVILVLRGSLNGVLGSWVSWMIMMKVAGRNGCGG